MASEEGISSDSSLANDSCVGNDSSLSGTDFPGTDSPLGLSTLRPIDASPPKDSPCSSSYSLVVDVSEDKVNSFDSRYLGTN